MFPHFKNIRQFTEDEIKIYDEVMPVIEKSQRITKDEKVIVNALYKGVFGNNPTWKSCSPCNKQIIDKLLRRSLQRSITEISEPRTQMNLIHEEYKNIIK